MKKATNLGPFFLLSLYFLALAYSLSPWFGYYIDVTGFNEQRTLQIFIYLISVALILLIGIDRLISTCRLCFSRQSLIALFALVLTACFISFFAEYQWRSLQDSFIYASVLLSSLLIAYRLKDVSQNLISAFISSAVLVVAFIFFVHFLIYYIFCLSNPDAVVIGGIPKFSNVRTFNHLQVLVIPLLLNSCFELKDGRLKIFAFFLCAFWICLLFYTGARGALLSLVTVVGIQWLMSAHDDNAYFKKYAYVTLTGFFLYLFLFKILPNIFLSELSTHTLLRSGSTGRVELWLLALKQGINCLPLGCGGQSFVSFTALHHSAPAGTPHNILLHVFVEYGLLSLVLFGFLVYRGLKYFWVHQKNSISTFAHTTSLVCYLVYSLFSGVYMSTISLVLLPVIAGCLLASKIKSENVILSDNRDSYLSRALVLLLIVIFLCGLAVSLFDLSNVLNEISGGSRYPRFWSNGGFFLK